MAESKIKTEELGLPSFGIKPQEIDWRKYRIRYIKAEIGDPETTGELELIETKSLAGDEIILFTKDTFTFMDKFFIVRSYLEKRE